MMTFIHPLYRFLKTAIHAVRRRVSSRLRPSACRRRAAVETPVYARPARAPAPPAHRQPDAPRPVDAAAAETYATAGFPDVEDLELRAVGAWSPDGDLGLTEEGRQLSKEALESWVSAGLLYPEEIRAAEKLIKAMRQRNR